MRVSETLSRVKVPRLNAMSKVTCPFNALGAPNAVPSHFPMEHRHEASLVSREPRMKRGDSKWYINDHCHGSVIS